MREMAVMIIEIICQNPPQMLRMKHDQVIQLLAPDGADQPLDEWILPG